MDKEQKRYSIIGLAVGVIVLGVIFYFISNKTSEVSPKEDINENQVPQGEIKEESKVENIDKPAMMPDPRQDYKDLLKKANEAYLKQNYSSQLTYLKQALALEQNDRIYRSLYTAYKELKQYNEARVMIQKAVAFSKQYPNNWLEYASFEHLYMKSSFEIVSKIYLDGLVSTKDSVDLITAYSGYLVEYKKYNEAIQYLEKAKLINPAGTSIYQSEIDYLETLNN